MMDVLALARLLSCLLRLSDANLLLNSMSELEGVLTLVEAPPSATVFNPCIELDVLIILLDFTLLVELATLLALLMLIFRISPLLPSCMFLLVLAPCLEVDLSLKADVLV